MISMILACGLNGEIGNTSRPDGLPWDKNPDDLKHFSSLTKGNVVVMGGNTFRQLQDIGFENGLPDRDNYVISRDHSRDDEYVQSGSMKCMEYLLRVGYWERDVFIIGGKSIYSQLHPYCDRVYLTRIDKAFPDADVRINLDFLCNFAIISRKKLNEYSHVEVWERKK
ncbi:dihydrofolate reductase [Vibrio phage 1.193.O._10N.286.52.C6]|nr:dihydrofolate reductase [Vibrio phage 1.193.O._10N.286.52.C6]